MKEYIIDLKSKENMRLYYASKNKFGEELADRDLFIKDISDKLNKKLSGLYDHVLIPESSSDFIESIVKKTGIPYTIVHKNPMNFIIANIDKLNLQNKEKKSHLERIMEMEGIFKIHKLKANQRRKYTGLLFEKIDTDKDKNYVIVDDSYFSGTTYDSLKIATNIEDVVFIFSK